MRLVSLSLLVVFWLVGCLSDSPQTDPYAGMTCEQKITAISNEIKDFPSSLAPLAKHSAPASDTTFPDSSSRDTASKAVMTFRPYPPVVRVDSLPQTGESDSRNDVETGGSLYDVLWIPPVGFDSSTPIPAPTPGASQDTTILNPETSAPTVMPKSISVVQIVSKSAYRALVRVYDFRSELIQEFHQDFGYRGELSNRNRVVPDGYVSFLVWDNRDASGHEVRSGVYLWKVRLEMASGETNELSTKIGYIGHECRSIP